MGVFDIAISFAGENRKLAEEIAYILDHEARNKLLIKLAMNQKKNTLMLFQFVDRHGKKLLADMNAQSDKHLKKVFFIYQKVSGDERELIRKTLDGADPVWYDFEFEKQKKINMHFCLIYHFRSLKRCIFVCNFEFGITKYTNTKCFGLFSSVGRAIHS